jgi:hypothetical protein
MAKQVLNAGSANNDKTGDTLRAGALKIKANFEEIYAALANDGMNISGGNVLKTGDYQDLRNKPEFAVVATSGDFYDLSARPDIGIFVGVPGNSAGSEGHVAGNLAFDGNNLYVCREDYVETEEFGSFNFLRADGDVAYSLEARFANTGSTIAFTQNESLAPIAPEVDWTVSDGTTTRTITAVSQELDGSTVYYLCTLDGAFTSTIGTHYTLSFPLASGQYAFYSTWNVAYQNLIDAHALGKSIHLHVTYDGYGRLVNHVARNSITNEIVVTYTAGSEIADYEGLTIKIDQPSIWKSVPWAPYGSGFTGIDLGDFKIQGSYLGTQGSTEETWGATSLNISPNGEGSSWLWLPNNSEAASGGDTELGNYGDGGISLITSRGSLNLGGNMEGPGVPQHFHIAFSGSNSTIPTQDLFLGDDYNYLQVVNYAQGVFIGTNDRNEGAQNVWRFNTNGTVTFPTLTTDIHNGGNQSAQTLQFGNPSEQVIITGPTPDVDTNAQRIIIQGQRGYGTGEGGDVYLWGGDAENNGGDIKIYAGDADDGTTGYGGYINIDGGYGFTHGGDVYITGGSSNTTSGNLTLRAGQGGTHGSVYVSTYGNQWTFDASGNITLPAGGDIKDSSGNSVLTAVTGQQTYDFDGVNTTLTVTNLNFNLLFCQPAIGYMGNDGHTVDLPAAATGQRLVIINSSSLCTLAITGIIDFPLLVNPSTTAELIYSTAGWLALYGTTPAI